MAESKNGGATAQPALSPEQLAKLKPIDIPLTFVGGFQVHGTGTDFTLYCQQTKALLTDTKEFTPHGRREVVAAITMSPHALKDLSILLTQTVAEYEKLYGKLETDYTRRVAAAQKK